jgi:ribosomal protein L37AE/L43A
MSSEYRSRVACPFCESGEMRAVNASLARCSSCATAMDHGFFRTLLQIRALADTEGEHACQCGHSEIHRVSEGRFRCPACGGEITPPIEHSP